MLIALVSVEKPKIAEEYLWLREKLRANMVLVLPTGQAVAMTMVIQLVALYKPNGMRM